MSAIYVNSIKDKTNTRELASDSGSAWSWGSGVPAGTVLQVVSTETNSRATYSNFFATTTAWQDLMSLSITPSAESSKVLVLVSCAVGTNSLGWAGRILQAGSTVADHLGSPTSSSRTHITFGTVPYAVNDDEIATANYTGLFSPSSTSAVEYKVQGAGRGDSWSFNRCEDGTDSYGRADAVSTLTLMEIQG